MKNSILSKFLAVLIMTGAYVYEDIGKKNMDQNYSVQFSQANIRLAKIEESLDNLSRQVFYVINTRDCSKLRDKYYENARPKQGKQK